MSAERPQDNAGNSELGGEDMGPMEETYEEVVVGPQAMSTDNVVLVQVRDRLGNEFHLAYEDLLAAGIEYDANSVLTDEQASHLLALMRQQQDLDGGIGDDSAGDAGTVASMITISYDESDGVLLAVPGQDTMHFSRDQLAQMGLEARSLSDESIHRLLELGGVQGTIAPSDGQAAEESEPRPSGSKRTRVDTPPGRSSTTSPLGRQRPFPSMVKFSSGSASSSTAGHAPVVRRPVNNALINEAVQIKHGNGKTLQATVRYAQPGRGYKVQFPDGRFEWVTSDNIVGRTHRISDHQGYTMPPGSMAPGPSSASLHPVRRLQAPPRVRAPIVPRMNAMPSAGTVVMNQQHTVVHHRERGGGGGGAYHGEASDAQFTCPLCDKKVIQKEPAYIVIRLPACEACTRAKILVMDEEFTQNMMRRPAMMSVACDTSDLEETMRMEDGRRVPKVEVASEESDAPILRAPSPEVRVSEDSPPADAPALSEEASPTDEGHPAPS